MSKYQAVNMADKNELAAIVVGDRIRINDWRNGMNVIHRTEDYLLLAGAQFGKELISVIELLPAKCTYNHREKGHFTAGGDFWLFGWAGWRDENLNILFDEERMEAYLRSFESGETEFSRRAVAVRSMQVLKAHRPREGCGMIKIDCLKCVNCDLEKDCCKKYGSNPAEAVAACAADGFSSYAEAGEEREG